MDNKLSELSKPVAWTDERGNLCTNRNKERGLESRYHQDYEKYTTPFYSQEYVSALDKVAQFWIGESAGWKQRAEDAEKRIAELESDLGLKHIRAVEEALIFATDRNSELEAKLATPVRLPDSDMDSALIMAHWCSGEEVNAWVKGINYAKQQIRAAGFTVEGDE